MDRKILVANLFKTGYGTHHYDVKYKGEWDDEELITAIDNKAYDNPTAEQLVPCHFGGYVEKHYSNEGITRATVGVYYD